jgi:hypothetical protein
MPQQRDAMRASDSRSRQYPAAAAAPSGSLTLLGDPQALCHLPRFHTIFRGRASDKKPARHVAGGHRHMELPGHAEDLFFTAVRLMSSGELTQVAMRPSDWIFSLRAW